MATRAAATPAAISVAGEGVRRWWELRQLVNREGYTAAMTSAARNVIGILVAVVAGYIALAIAATVDSALGYPRSYETIAGEIFVRFTALWPYLVSAVVIGVVAALIGRLSRCHGSLLVSVLAIGQYALGLRYVAPEWREWLATIIAMAAIGAVAVCGFSLAASRRSSNERHAEGSEPLVT